MKKKKNKPINKPVTDPPEAPNAALKKLQAKREKQKKGADSERAAVFSKKLKNAASRKAPFTQRTRGYYRFSRDFPAEVDSEGLRKNGEQKKRTARRAAVFAAVLLLVFCVSYTAAKTARYISGDTPPAAERPTDSAIPSAKPKNAVRYTGAQPEETEEDALAAAMRSADADIAVLEFKNSYGTVSMHTDLVAALHDRGKQAAAYISCFKDTAGAAQSDAMAIRSGSEENSIWKDNAGNNWLNPFSAEAREYLLSLVADAAETGYDYILLDNVCFPGDSGSSAAYYPGESEFTGTRNQLLRGFVNDAVNRAGTAQTILMCRFAAFDPDAAPEKAPYYGNMLGTSAGTICADARLSVQPKNCAVGETLFNDPADIPFAFTLAVGEYTVNNAENTRVLLCVDADNAADDALSAAGYAGAAGCILW